MHYSFLFFNRNILTLEKNLQGVFNDQALSSIHTHPFCSFYKSTYKLRHQIHIL